MSNNSPFENFPEGFPEGLAAMMGMLADATGAQGIQLSRVTVGPDGRPRVAETHEWGLADAAEADDAPKVGEACGSCGKHHDMVSLGDMTPDEHAMIASLEAKIDTAKAATAPLSAVVDELRAKLQAATEELEAKVEEHKAILKPERDALWSGVRDRLGITDKPHSMHLDNEHNRVLIDRESAIKLKLPFYGINEPTGPGQPEATETLDD